MITRVQVKNFRSIASADVSLGPLTVLVGRNGAGKSAFVDVLRFVRDALEHNLEYAFSQRGGIDSVRRWSPNKPQDLEIHLRLEIANIPIDFGFVIGSGTKKNDFHVKGEYCRIFSERSMESYEVENGKWIRVPAFIEFMGRRGMLFDSVSYKRRELVSPSILFISPELIFQRSLASLSGNVYNIFPNTLRLPQILSNEETLAEDGSNFASVLRSLKKSTFFSDLRSAVNRIVDGVRDVRVRQSGGFLFVELQHGDLLGNANSKAPWLGLEQESDGTLRILAMLTALYQKDPKPPFSIFPTESALILEEPEISLHPGALAVLADVIREASLRRQVIITTQSPDLISRFNADELRVVERVNGATQIGPLDSVQRQAVVDNLFSAGDLLRVEGLRREPDEAVIK